MMNSKKNLTMKNLFDENYYENGTELKISGYSHYRWLPDRTIPFCYSIIKFLKINKNHKILDFGAAKGFMVKAFRMLGYSAWGKDISQYAIENADHEIKSFMSFVDDNDGMVYDWVIAKDVLEHIPYDEIDDTIEKLKHFAPNMFIIVPLGRDNKFIIKEYENDITHHIREPANWWIELFCKHDLELIKYSNNVKNMKENWSHFDGGNGFFIFRKIK